MKNMMKRLMTFMLALVLAVTLTPTNAFAETTNDGSITIIGAIEGETYSIYKLANLTTSSDGKAYAYTAVDETNKPWKAFLQGQTSYVSVDARTGAVTWIGSDTTKAQGTATFAAAAKQYVEDSKETGSGYVVDADATETAQAPASGQSAVTTTLTFNELPLGWYLVLSNTGSIAMLDNTDKTATITEKNAIPSIVKEIRDGYDLVDEVIEVNDYKVLRSMSANSRTNDSWGHVNSAEIGEVIEFRTTVTLTAGYNGGFTIHDKMDEALTFLNSDNYPLKVNHIKASGDTEELQSTQFDVVATDDIVDNCTFEVVISENDVTLAAGDEIELYYYAKLNENAYDDAYPASSSASGNTGVVNRTRLEYENELYTTWDETHTYTYEFGVYKYGVIEDGTVSLGGAAFELYRTAGLNIEDGGDSAPDLPTYGEKVYFVRVGTGGNVPRYRVASSDESGAVSTITTTDDGRFIITGLSEENLYWLVETAAPSGYHKIETPVPIRFEQWINNTTYANNYTSYYYGLWTWDGTGEKPEVTSGYMWQEMEKNSELFLNKWFLPIENETGTELPATGGKGALLFYALGIAVFTGSVSLIYIYIKRKKTRVGK